jgi:hypothetical protein
LILLFTTAILSLDHLIFIMTIRLWLSSCTNSFTLLSLSLRIPFTLLEITFSQT